MNLLSRLLAAALLARCPTSAVQRLVKLRGIFDLADPVRSNRTCVPTAGTGISDRLEESGAAECTRKIFHSQAYLQSIRHLDRLVLDPRLDRLRAFLKRFSSRSILRARTQSRSPYPEATSLLWSISICLALEATVEGLASVRSSAVDITSPFE